MPLEASPVDYGWITLVLFWTRRRDESLELKEGLERRVRKSRQKEAAGICGGRGDCGRIELENGVHRLH